ncbi:MAG: hypothetical protein ACTTKL_08525 [Treponema sp.]
MKQSKLVSMVGALALMVSAAFVIAGCKQTADEKSDKTEIPSEYVGSYEGTFSGNIVGTWQMTADKFDAVTGNFNDGSTDYPASGTLGSDGKLSGEMTLAAHGVKIAFKGTVNKSSGNVSGTWENSTIHKNGTFTGNKK